MTTPIIDALQHAVDKCAELSAENKALKAHIEKTQTRLDERRTENHDLMFKVIGLRAQNEELRTALLRSAERTNQAAIAAATYKESVHHAS